MSSLLYALGRLAFRRWGRVLAVWALAAGALGAGAGLLGQGTSDTFRIPGVESFEAFDRLGQTFPEVSGAAGQVVAVAAEGDVTDPDHRRRIESLVRVLREVDQVAFVLSPYDEMVTGTISPDRSAAVIQVQMTVGSDEVTEDTRAQLEQVATEASGRGLSFHAGGGAFGPEPPVIGATEGIGLAVALVVLALTFGSLVAAGLPLLGALGGIAVSMAGIWLATAWLTVTSTAPFLALMIGLAVGIDYGLFVLARHRDQLREGLDPEESAGRAVATAGSAVVFAGLTVMIALAGLMVTRIPFLTVMGLSAAFAVLVAVLVALTLVPALLGMLKGRIAPSRRSPRRPRRGFADRWVAAVTRFPLLTVLVVGAGLVALAVPAADLRLALPDNGTAPEGTTQRTTYDLISEKFGVGHNGPLLVTADIVQSTDPLALVADVERELAALDGVASIPIATPNPDADTMIIQVTPETGPTDVETERLLQDIRDLRPALQDEYGIDIAVTGQTAAAVDVSERLASALLPFALLVMGLSLVLLAIVFRSIAVPVKATVGYLLSVAASFGVVVLVYQEGLLAEELHTVAVGPIVCFLPILLMGLLFGLAMDYEVFLVSRMREEFVHGTEARRAVRTGFTASARVVTAAAVIMIAVFAAFVPHGDATTQPIALALAVGVFVDAFLVRMTLVPAAMALMGRRAWWFPRVLDRRLPVLDVEGEGVNRQVALADWPMPDHHGGVLAQDLALRGVLGPLGLDVAPGEVAVLADGSAEARTALALALAGRLRTTAGRLKVAGHVLPEQSVLVRPSVALVRVADEADVEAGITAALRRRTRVLVVDGLEAAPATATRQGVLELALRLARERDLAVVVTVSPDVLDTLPPLDPDLRLMALTPPVLEGAYA